MYKEASDFHKIALPMFLMVCVVLFLMGCGQNEVDFSSTNCTVEGKTVKCPDGTEVQIVDGENGKDGLPGEKGDEGNTGAIGPKGNTGATGASGATGPRGLQGIAGAAGVPGKDGKDGANGRDGLNGAQGPKGETGEKGEKGDSGSALTVHNIPTRGVCVDIGDGLYVENEGAHADVYNNDDCDHGPSPKENFCNNLEDSDGKSKVCWVGKRQFSVQGRYSDMLLYEINFN